jgi:hypothetical protein
VILNRGSCGKLLSAKAILQVISTSDTLRLTKVPMLNQGETFVVEK